ncbi:MAG TPA: protease inhibitor I42 family protein [Allosphingosinicella sp.]|nr:protease inhibitor I42 family protein [Allosphingosinicella sp.]
MRNLDLGDDGGKVELKVGETLSVRLAENATTGYRWMAEGIDPRVLAVSSGEADYPDDAIGSGGEATFSARAVAPGETDFTLVNRRPWEGESAGIHSFRVRVTVRAAD